MPADDMPGTTVSGTVVVPDTPIAVLRQFWGHDAFRGIQADIIGSILERRDTLGLMPTGGGKSVAFQVPALMMEGTCIVVTPLVALMKDQVAHLRERGIKATCVHSGLTHDQILREFDNCILGHYKFLYLSPERLHSSLFISKLKRLTVSFITVDEAHCISQWGYDFRPSYLTICELRRLLPGVPVLALTATATPRVADDIVRQLEFAPGARRFTMSFARPNLDYSVVQCDDKVEAIVHALLTSEGSAIVYVRSRAGTRDLALTLQQRGVTASYYHAGLSTVEKDTRQQMWQTGRARVMVATNAFGMGIDKADVRLVLHLDPPDSLEAYFQEAGRAGRDGRPARAVLYYAESDVRLMRQRVHQTFPPKEKVRDIYDDLACYFQLAVGDGYGVRYELDVDEFSRRFRHFPVVVESALLILQRAGYLTYSAEDEGRSRVMVIVRRDDLYHYNLGNSTADRLLLALLRRYEGLFADYVNIDERVLASDTGCTPDDVYRGLQALMRQRLLHYIPRKHVPSLVYDQRRVDHSRVVLSREVYDDRLAQYVERIGSVIGYLTDTATPCAAQLLRYFGEEPTAEMLAAAPDTPPPAPDSAEAAVEAIMADGEPHHPTQFHALPFPRDEVNAALLGIIDQGRAEIINGHFKLK